MPTTVHIPEALLKSIDARAKHLNISRNRFVVRALEQAVAARSEWSPQFVAALGEAVEGAELVDEMLTHIEDARRSRKRSPL